MASIAWVIPLCPLAAFLLIAFGARRSHQLSASLGIIGVAISFALSIGVFMETLAGVRFSQSIDWLPFPSSIQNGQPVLRTFFVGFQVDSLTSIMLVVVTSVSLLVQIYSLGYMAGDKGFSRYYAFISLFTMSMLGLVLANNLLAIYIFWELVGLCSYLLIGHWHDRPEAAAAAKKAFLVTRVGDVGFLLGILFLYWHSGTLEFTELAARAAAGAIPASALTVGLVLVFCGAVGKSAQFPLHVWLPDAMEGPTPVSALIHAATMVAAGVYLMARIFPILEHSPTALLVVAVIGAFTAFFAATMGLVATDIKRVLAYSTVSQLGYMMLAIGLGAMGAGIFHLFNHAFFKALLFLGAGSVIHAVGTNEMFEMGGLRKRLPVTAVTMTIAAVSLAGIPPLSGFWSKDEILGAALVAQPGLFVLALMTVGLTAFYMFRVIFLTFGGEYRGPAQARPHPDPLPEGEGTHGEPLSMKIPLLILAIPSVVSGLWGMPFIGNPFGHFVESSAAVGGVTPHLLHAPFNPMIAGLSVLVALGGIGVAWAMYGGGKTEVGASLSARFRLIHQILLQRYYMDDLYNWLVTRVVLGIARVATFFDSYVIDGTVNGTGAVTILLGSTLRRAQSGQVQTYAWVLFAGILALAAIVATLRVSR